MKNLEKYDKNMIANVIESDENYDYYDVKQPPFRIEGLAWFEKEKKWDRIGEQYKDKVSEAVAWLSTHPAGGQMYFHTNAKTIVIKVKLADKANMIHMPATGQTGFDLYFKTNDMKEYQFFTTSTYPYGNDTYTAVIFRSDTAFDKDILIHFPLYMGVKEVYIGLEKGATLTYATPHQHEGRVVVYGTSITQGGCACRPGTAYLNLLSRKLDIEFINLGFSGSGLGELIMADLINEIENVKMIVLDYEANGGCTGHLEKYMEEFIDILRTKHPYTPILVITKPPFSNYLFMQKEVEERKRIYHFQKNLVSRRRKTDKQIYFFDGQQLYGKEDIFESSVDGLHPTDLGFYRMYKALYPTFYKILFCNKNLKKE